jgi:Family of unknown function (DUF6252)
LYTDSLKILEGVKFNLRQRIQGLSSGSYSSYTTGSPFQNYLTDGNDYKGEMQIKKLDPENQIVSGTFWFDAVNANGQKVEIREGRFDVRFTL